MPNVATIEKLDPVIHPHGRLKIMTALAPQESLSFTELKEELAMTDGNLCVHMRTLEEAGYVSVRKSFVNRKPRTEYSLTPEGRRAFQEYVETLAEIVKESQPVEQPRPVLQQGIATAK